MTLAVDNPIVNSPFEEPIRYWVAVNEAGQLHVKTPLIDITRKADSKRHDDIRRAFE